MSAHAHDDDMGVNSADGVRIGVGRTVNILSEPDDEPGPEDGRVIRIDVHTNQCDVRLERGGAVHTVPSRRLRIVPHARRPPRSTRALDTLRELGPRILGELVMGQGLPEAPTVVVHDALECMPLWATDADVGVILEHPDRTKMLGVTLAQAAAVAGSLAQALRDTPAWRGCTAIHPCDGCNTPFDNGGCMHEGAPPKVPLDESAANLAHAAHDALYRLVLVRELLMWTPAASRSRAHAAASAPAEHERPGGREDGGGGDEDEEVARAQRLADGQRALLNLLAADPPAELARHIHVWVAQTHQHDEARPNSISVLLVGLIDNCHTLLPKVAGHAAALLSCLTARRPAAVLPQLDPAETERALNWYVGRMMVLATGPCVVEERFAVAQLLTLTPVLYHLGDWRGAHRWLAARPLGATLASLALNLLHEVDLDMAPDSPVDLTISPELDGCGVHTLALHGAAGAALLRRRPVSACIGALVETLGRWQTRGVDVSSARIPCKPPPHLALSAAEAARYSEPVRQCFAEYVPRFEAWAAREPQLAYVLPIVHAFASGATPALPAEQASPLLRYDLHAGMTCSLPSCGRATLAGSGGSDGGAVLPLRLCAGGCSGLARYCSREHQQEHRPVHKHFCKRNAGAG